MSQGADKFLSEKISVVLVEPLQGGNVGAVARALLNMRMGRLKLVHPRVWWSAESRKMAGKAVHLLQQAEVFPDLCSALTREHLVVGTTSSRDRRKRREILSPREIAPLLLEQAREQNVSLVFGPERRGLTEDQLARCQYLVRIPTGLDHPVLNLSQSVMILAYELFIQTAPPGPRVRRLATQDERERLFRQMEDILVRIGFLSSANPAHVMRTVRDFLGRARLNPREVRILQGIFSQMEWYVDTGKDLPAERIRKP